MKCLRAFRNLSLAVFFFQNAIANCNSISSIYLGSRERDPESLVQNVSTIHGDYTEVEVDLVVPSPDSLILSRFYSSRDTLQIASLGGWRFNPHCFLTMQKDPEEKTYTDGKGTFERYYVYVGNPDGSILTYVGWKNITNPLKRTLFKIDAEAKTVGLANTAKGNISGWTNLKNNELYFDPQANSFELSLCSEGKRFYVKNPSTDLYFITHEILPSGNKVFYEFDTQGQLTLIKETNGSEKKVLAWINIQYSNVIHIQTSDGKIADYHFEQDPSGAHLLTQVYRSDKPDLHYEYQVVDNHALLLKKTLPEGRFLEVDYDSDEENQYKVKSIITPGGLSGITSTQFSYEDHCTQVDGPGNHKAVYRFDGDFQLIAIEQFLDGALYRIHKKSWGKKSHAGNLISTSVEDSEANIFYYKYFVYDNKDKGNIIQEREYGDFTGIGAIPLIIDQNGLVKNHDGHTRNYSYFSGEKTHGFFRRDSNGMGVKYWYKKGTNRLIKKFTLAYGSQDSEEEDEDSGIEQRHFYRYNEDAALTRVIVDDGYEEQVGQTSGITQRLITTIVPKKDLPNLGAPEVIEQKYKDSEDGTEVLLKRTVNQFDGQGNVISQAVYDANAEYRYSVTKAYAQGLLILETDPLGYETQYSYDANHNLISESHSDTGISIEYRYDLRNQLIDTVEKDSRRNCWESSISYDFAGYKISEIDRFGNETLYVNDSLGRTVSITYPEVGDGQHSTIRPTYTYTYDLFDHQTSVTDPQGRVISKSYNVRNKPTSIQYPDGTKESFRYDSGGNLHHYYGRDGLIQVFEYDEMGRLKHVQHYKRGSQGAEPFKENSYEYNAFHKISETNERDEKTTYIYDKAGRLAILRKDNRKTEFIYDALGRMQGVKKCRGSQAFTLQVKEYDLLDRVIEERTENSKGLILLKSRYVYNDAGQVAQVIGYPQNKESILVQYEYDGFGRLTKTVNTERGITEIFYDDAYINEWGQKTRKCTQVDPTGNQMEELFDYSDHLIKVTKKDKAGTLLAESEYSYDSVGNKLFEKATVLSDDAATKTYETHWFFNQVGQLEQVTLAKGTTEERTTRFEYNAYGELVARHNPGSQEPITYEYNAAANLKKLSYREGQNQVNFHITYDTHKNITRVRSDTYTLERTFDPHDLTLSEAIEDEFGSYQVNYVYNAEGRIRNLELPDGTSINYTYSGPYVKSATRLSKNKKELYTYQVVSRDQMGHITEETLPGNTGRRNQYWDEAGRRVEISTPVLQDKVLEGGYDTLDHIRKRETTLQEEKQIAEYDYNDLSQLILEKSDIEHRYAYDSIDNRLRKDDSVYTLNALNELIETEDAAYTFDPNGSLETKTIGDSNWTYHSNPLNQLITIKDPAQNTITFTYDLSGVRREVAQILVVAKQQLQILLCNSTERCA